MSARLPGTPSPASDAHARARFVAAWNEGVSARALAERFRFSSTASVFALASLLRARGIELAFRKGRMFSPSR